MSQQTWRGRVAKSAPPVVRDWVAAARLRRIRQRNATRSVEDVFSEIYAAGRWGGGGAFNSGTGSRGDAAATYGRYVRELLRATGARTAVDLGCGDFVVAAQFVDDLDAYHGVDIVRDLIERNTRLFGRDGVTFSVLDASDARLPTADVCLVRQVLQHLSNDQIARILHRCRAYPLVVVTEHWPAQEAARVPNIDKPHGPDTRLDRGSWVNIAEPPFNCGAVEEVLRMPVSVALCQPGETITTQLWRP
jgi:SAM-dependent methyltransferase